MLAWLYVFYVYEGRQYVETKLGQVWQDLFQGKGNRSNGEWVRMLFIKVTFVRRRCEDWWLSPRIDVWYLGRCVAA